MVHLLVIASFIVVSKNNRKLFLSYWRCLEGVLSEVMGDGVRKFGVIGHNSRCLGIEKGPAAYWPVPFPMHLWTCCVGHPLPTVLCSFLSESAMQMKVLGKTTTFPN